MKKSILMCFMLVLSVCILFTGCNKDEDLERLGKYEGLDAKTELQIIKWYYGENYKGQESVDNWPGFGFYLGVYDGWVIFNMSLGWFTIPDNEDIDGLLFVYTGTGYVFAWKDGDGNRLKVLYKNGLITRIDLGKIHAQYIEFYCDFLKELYQYGHVPIVDVALTLAEEAQSSCNFYKELYENGHISIEEWEEKQTFYTSVSEKFESQYVAFYREKY